MKEIGVDLVTVEFSLEMVAVMIVELAACYDLRKEKVEFLEESDVDEPKEFLNEKDLVLD